MLCRLHLVCLRAYQRPRRSSDAWGEYSWHHDLCLKTAPDEGSRHQEWPALASQPLPPRGSVLFGIQLSRTERLLQVLPTGMDQFGVAPDLIDLDLGAVTLYVRLLEYLVEFGVLIYAMDDVAEDLLLPPGPARVTPKEEPP